MKRSKWQEVPGLGAQILEQMSEHVLLWQRNREHLARLELVREDLEMEAQIIGQRAVDASMRVGDLDDLSASLDSAQQSTITETYLSKIAAENLRQLKAGKDFYRDLELSDKKVRITARRCGVMVLDRFSVADPNDEEFAKAVQLPEEESAIGTVWTLNSSPETGGYIRLHNFKRTTSAKGLVHPISGVARVDMDILVRPGDIKKFAAKVI